MQFSKVSLQDSLSRANYFRRDGEWLSPGLASLDWTETVSFAFDITGGIQSVVMPSSAKSSLDWYDGGQVLTGFSPRRDLVRVKWDSVICPHTS